MDMDNITSGLNDSVNATTTEPGIDVIGDGEQFGAARYVYVVGLAVIIPFGVISNTLSLLTMVRYVRSLL